MRTQSCLRYLRLKFGACSMHQMFVELMHKYRREWRSEQIYKTSYFSVCIFCFHGISKHSFAFFLNSFFPWKRFLVPLISFSFVEHFLMILRGNTSAPQKPLNLLPLGWDPCHWLLTMSGWEDAALLWPLFGNWPTIPPPPTTQIYYLTLLEVTSLKSASLVWNQGVGLSAFLLEAVEENLFPASRDIPPSLALSSMFKASSIASSSLWLCAPASCLRLHLVYLDNPG